MSDIIDTVYQENRARIARQREEYERLWDQFHQEKAETERLQARVEDMHSPDEVRGLKRIIERQDARVEELEAENHDLKNCNAVWKAQAAGDTNVYAALYFYYDDPDSMRRLRECNQAASVKAIISEFDQWLRSEIKYSEREDEDTFEEIREKLWRLADDEGIDWWD